ncbi:MAG: SEC-C domain-containing protein [Desulfohalobiaceae bacterium]|nr:SEC-C domain-containing protein [Desulfohalobiaceae bacterium]
MTQYCLRFKGNVLMAKLKRNDPCSCGSGKKYKK